MIRSSRFLSLAALALLSVPAFSQTPPACTQVATNRAHVCWARPTTYTDGTGVSGATVITYNVELQQGTSWVNAASNLSGLEWTSGVLTPGTYTYRVIACVGTTCSGPSNTGAKNVAQPATNPVTITIAGTQNGKESPIFSTSANQVVSTWCGATKLGRECGEYVGKFRKKNMHRVTVERSELWGCESSTDFVAPCAAASS